jgi:tetratricopeptide (TPR) repeat protein
MLTQLISGVTETPSPEFSHGLARRKAGLTPLWLPVLAVALAGPTLVSQSATLDLDKVAAWLAAVEAHQPGAADVPAATIAAWPTRELIDVVADVNELAKGAAQLHASFARSGKPPTGTYRGRAFTLAELDRALGLTEAEAGRGNANRVVTRGALLHTDIALLIPTGQEILLAGQTSPDAPPTSVVIDDGRTAGVRRAGVHWAIARALLDAVRPDPAADETVRRWYHAAIAWQQSRSLFGDASATLARAQDLLPSDARVLFYNGVQHEVFASARTQNTLQAIVTPPGTEVGVQSDQAEWRMANRSLRQAVALEPGFAEARLHAARVTGLLGAHAEAADDLRRAAGALTDPRLLYYAALFLGHEEEQLVHREAARASFEQAAALFPRAQTPLLALSQLARQGDDAAGARAALQRMLAFPASDSARDDPWWDYDRSHVRDADTLVVAWRRPFFVRADR